eukprot:4245470-Pleurochrysis_carterae.AAC.2
MAGLSSCPARQDYGSGVRLTQHACRGHISRRNKKSSCGPDVELQRASGAPPPGSPADQDNHAGLSARACMSSCTVRPRSEVILPRKKSAREKRSVSEST